MSIKKNIINNKIFKFAYSFIFLRKKFKKSIVDSVAIELTDACNLKCSYCPKSFGIGNDGGFMDFKLFESIVDQSFHIKKIKNVALVGFGEPLLYPYLFDAVEYVKNKDAEKIFLTTNGILLDKKNRSNLLDSGVTDITISVNAVSREKYKEINKADFYDIVKENAILFLEEANKTRNKINIVIQVMNELNTDKDIDLFYDFWGKKIGKNGKIQLQPIVNWAGVVKRNIIEEGARYPCAHIQSSWIFSREGNALPCCMVFPGNESDLELGNVRNKSIEDLYTKGKIVNLRRMNMQGDLYKLNPCKFCDAYKTIPNIWIKNPFRDLFGSRWI